MSRYFFHIRDGERLIEDPEGTDLPDLAAARDEAVLAARFLMSEKVKAGQVLDGQRFEITDEAGQVLDVLPFRAVLRLE